MSGSESRDPHPSERWVRGFMGGRVIVDSREQLLVWEPQLPVPRYLFRAVDVDATALRQTEPPSRLSYHHPNGAVTEWFDVVVGQRVIPHAAWRREQFPGHLGVTWKYGAFDEWREEEQVVVEHPHDPFVHIDALPSSRLVTVAVDGQVVASSRRAVFLWETGLPSRYYLPREDVDFALMSPTSTHSICPYKGFATEYWSVGSSVDVAWSYPEPFLPYRNIAGLVAFLNEKVDIRIDGVLQERPVPTVWPARSRL